MASILSRPQCVNLTWYEKKYNTKVYKSSKSESSHNFPFIAIKALIFYWKAFKLIKKREFNQEFYIILKS